MKDANSISGTMGSLFRQKYFWLVLLSVIGTTALLYSSIRGSSLDELYRELYYFPLFVAALRYGSKGAMICLGAIFSLYIPYICISWRGEWEAESARILELLFYFLFAAAAGYLTDRERKIRAELDRNRFITSLGRITSGIVHDLKNPIMSITGLLERLAAGKGDNAQYLPLLLKDAHRMERIVRDVLDFAKPVNLHKSKVEISEVVKNAMEICREGAEKQGVSIKAELHENTGEVDTFLLERALVNVISNAIEASQHGDSVIITSGELNGGYIITVVDDGPGLTGEAARHCFDPYFSTKSHGTGLGLPIVKKIVEAHEGRVEITSPIGRSGGTRIDIYLP